MRLKCIKLAGFKSFVDPTTVTFPGNLCAVVGPNGCGKSNIIDAVRWVMGESSVKNLRGESMSDVIFNGSGGRKPVGQASIELVFDNSTGSLKGEYAAFNEISIRRTVNRDGQSSYFLNSSKCRRRDITDVFLGTGLGPRSYSIIEQGMISNLIESKPEELRGYIEEAAGISKYKDRRKDTENRIKRTRENLERLTDIRDELTRQLQRLERQSRAAEKYTEFKKAERLLRGQLQALRWQDFNGQLQRQNRVIAEDSVKIEALRAEKQRCDTALEKQRQDHTECNEKLREVQGRYYAAGAEVARLEQAIKHARERAEELRRDIEQTQRSFGEMRDHVEADREKVVTWDGELNQVKEQLDGARQRERVSTEQLSHAEDKMQSWQADWDDFTQRAALPEREAEVQRSKIEHMERSLIALNQRLHRLQEEQQGLAEAATTGEVASLDQALKEAQSKRAGAQAQHEALLRELGQKREELSSLSSALHRAREALQKTQGRHASLEALQKAAREGDTERQGWLQANGMGDAQYLSDALEVAPGWETAVETVLGDFLRALHVDSVGESAGLLESWCSGQLLIVENRLNAGAEEIQAGSLADKVTSQLPVVGRLLRQVRAVDSLGQALSLRDTLAPGCSVISRDGHWLGADWARVTRNENRISGVLVRQRELTELEQSLNEQRQQVAGLEDKLKGSEVQLRDLEQRRESSQEGLAELQRAESGLSSEIQIARSKQEQVTQRRSRLEQEHAEIDAQVQREKAQLSTARQALESATEAMAANEAQRETLLTRRDDCRKVLDEARQSARHDQNKTHELVMRERSLNTQLAAMREGIERLDIQLQRLAQRQASLLASQSESDDPCIKLQTELDERLERRLDSERELGEARRQVDEIEAQIREFESKRGQIEDETQQVRSDIEQKKIAAQELQTRCQAIEEQIVELDYVLESLIEALPADASQQAWQEELTQVENRIQRLGSINLAAMDEYKIESERKTYLDAQHEELVEALETLEAAIRKIDRETRTKFKETYDTVNSSLQQLFPKLFGGGHAYLELTGDDLLDTGVTIMARPPGKKNASIHLLSGGEKALTAIALVFSIFKLNPAPFCMLDEVDAPLDDVNVTRYANMVKEMSQAVQFIYITHNKIAMEMAQQLMGVTMNEPGVSRMVSVDVDEAVQLAQ